MGVARTDEWLKEYAYDPVKMCSLACPNIKESKDFYQYLTLFGMYRPARNIEAVVKKMKEQGAWEKIRSYYSKYQTKWNGPRIQIYIFPIQTNSSYWMKHFLGKSGVSFPDKIFLFLSPFNDEKEWESIFVHEYHHSARLHALGSVPEKNTLLDSLVLEGLAEFAVASCCGESYRSSWTRQYSESILARYWKQVYIKHLTVSREDRLHDDLLFGRRGIPPMMGYAMGDRIVQGYKRLSGMPVEESIGIKAAELVHSNEFTLHQSEIVL